jgi:hypothetical protein
MLTQTFRANGILPSALCTVMLPLLEKKHSASWKEKVKATHKKLIKLFKLVISLS